MKKFKGLVAALRADADTMRKAHNSTVRLNYDDAADAIEYLLRQAEDARTLPVDAQERVIRVMGQHRRDDSQKAPIPMRDCTCGARVAGAHGADEHVAGAILKALRS